MNIFHFILELFRIEVPNETAVIIIRMHETNLWWFYILFVKFRKSSVKSLLHTYIVLSSAKFVSSASLMKKSKSFIKRLKGIGQRIDPLPYS